jgi:hypothetical protein
MRHILATKFLDRIERPMRGGSTPVAGAFLPGADANAIRIVPRRQLQQQGQMEGAQRFLSARRRQAG